MARSLINIENQKRRLHIEDVLNKHFLKEEMKLVVIQRLFFPLSHEMPVT